jgi:uncharacterized membrane protein
MRTPDSPEGDTNQPGPRPATDEGTRSDPPARFEAGLDREASRAVEEARRAFHVAAEKAGIAARELSRELRAGAAEAFEDLALIARSAHERVREMASEVLASAPRAGESASPEEHPPTESSLPPSWDAAAPGATAQEGSRPSAPPHGARARRLEPSLAAALAYAGWGMTGLLFYMLTSPSERFVRFHALQSILLTAAVAIVGGSVLAVPLIGRGLFAMAAAGFVLVWILVMWKALRREEYLLPFIGALARAHVKAG